MRVQGVTQLGALRAERQEQRPEAEEVGAPLATKRVEPGSFAGARMSGDPAS
jgi:hypothetical protein